MAAGSTEREVVEVALVATSEGVDAAITKAGQFGAALDRLEASQGRQATSSDRANAAAARSAAAKAQAEAAAARMQRQLDAESKALDMLERAQIGATQAAGGLTAAQQRAAQSAAAVEKAANDNSSAIGRQGEAYRAAGKFIAEHPVLTLAASVAAARALSGLATSAAGSLGAASASTAEFAAGASAMGPAVVGAATLAARGLAGLSSGATAAAGGLSTYAEKVAGISTASGLLARALSVLPGFIAPIAAAFLLFEAGSAAIGKAYSDLDRLIQLGERAEKLDVGAPFLKSFEALGPKIRANTDAMDAALSKASSFLRDQFGQGNPLSKLFGDIDATGVAGATGLRATQQADLARTTEDRIRAAIAGMQELDELGLHLASLQVGEKVFGPEFVERIRTGQTSIAQISADLEAASQKEVLRQEQVDRALALNRQIADTKDAISAALAVTFDWSGAAILLNEAWLKILQAVRWVVESVNDGITAVTNFGAAVASGIGGAFDAVKAKATDLLSVLGVVAKQQAAAEVQGPPEQFGPFQPKITAVQRSDVSGPPAPSFQQAAAGAKQAQQAASDAVSAYDSLIARTKDRIEELDLETRSVGQTTDAVIRMKLAHDLERAAQKSGIDVTESMRAEWDKLGTSLAASTDRLATAKRQLEVTRDAQRELGDEFSTFAEDVILGGKRIGEAFSGIAKTFASGSLKALLTGQGSLAGLFGVAPDKAGDLGGIFGGKFDLTSLFPAHELKEAVSGGTAEGNSTFWDGLFKQRQSQQGVSQGFFSSPIGGALAGAGAGAAIGYSSQSPFVGAAGGALTAFMASGGNPIAAAVGPAVGFGGTIGKRRPAADTPQPGTQETPRDGDQRPIAA